MQGTLKRWGHIKFKVETLVRSGMFQETIDEPMTDRIAASWLSMFPLISRPVEDHFATYLTPK